MKITSACIGCVLDIAFRTVGQVAKDRWAEYVVPIVEVIRKSFHPELTPGMLATAIQMELHRLLDNPDPYRKIKEASNNLAEVILEDITRSATNMDLGQVSLLTAAGNAIDFALETKVDEAIAKVKQSIDQGFYQPDDEQFDRILQGAREVLFLLDNAGEIVFDRYLATWIKEHYGTKISAVVNATPVLNDATPYDLETTGFAQILDDVVLLDPGAIGFPTDPLPEALAKKFRAVDAIICKGMGNFESLDECELEPPAIYILKAKCQPIASLLGTPVGANILTVRYQKK
ncbi:MAG: DUF89 family protein [Clostridia bacterium]|nr:DUF89 family protein [Clostridia bacterium]